MDETIKKQLEEMPALIKQLREANEENLKNSDAQNEEKMSKISDRLSELAGLKQRVEGIEAAAQRFGTSESKANNEEEEKEAKAFDGWLRKRKGSQEEIEIVGKNFMRTNNNPDGGYLVRDSFWTGITKRVFETSPMRSVASVQSIGLKSLKLLLDDNTGVSGGWVQEAGTISETNTPQLGTLEIVAHKQYAYPKLTEEMLDDSVINIESWLQEKTADIFARTENTTFITGNGVNTPQGILDSAGLTFSSGGTYARSTIEYVASGAAAAVTADGLMDLKASLHEPYQPGAVFLMNRGSYGEITKLKDGNGQYLYGLGLNGKGVMEESLLQKPVKFFDDMPAIGAGLYPIAYGDFRQAYQIVDKKGISILRDPLTSKGFIKYYTTKSVGGGVKNFEAYKVQKIATS